METLLNALVRQGGFALLAGLGFYLMYRMDQLRVADLKASYERERAISDRLIVLVQENTEALTNLADEIGALTRPRLRKGNPDANPR